MLCEHLRSSLRETVWKGIKTTLSWQEMFHGLFFFFQKNRNNSASGTPSTSNNNSSKLPITPTKL